jgi:hypothetical protein
VYPDNDEEDGFFSPILADIRRSYADLLQGLDYIGMLDPALFVSTQRTHEVPRFICYHVHALLWGLSQDKLDEFLEITRAKIKALLPYATPVEAEPIRTGTLLRVISYVTKMPRHQYQLAPRPNTISLRQYKRSLNGVNSVRLYGAMKDCTLDGLVLSGGAGNRVLKRMLRDLHDWRLEHSTLYFRRRNGFRGFREGVLLLGQLHAVSGTLAEFGGLVLGPWYALYGICANERAAHFAEPAYER